MLSELQSLLLPTSVVASAIVAKLVYVDLVLREDVSVSFFFGTGVLAGLIYALVGHKLDLQSTADIVGLRFRAGGVVAAASLSFLLLLSLFYLLKISDQVSRGWLSTWYLLAVAGVLMVRGGILLWARVLRAERRLLQRIAIYGSADLAHKVFSRLLEADRTIETCGFFTDDDDIRRLTEVLAALAPC